MPRDSTPTKESLRREAERLFARRGVYRVTMREITDAAGQRNVSAINYHFGSREGLLDAILARHGDPTDLARGELRAGLAEPASSRDLMAALVVPYAAHLATPEGRDYLRIVAQLATGHVDWRSPNVGTGPHLRDILTTLAERPAELPEAVRDERVAELIMLMTAAMSARAVQLESRRHPPALDEATFLANLTDVLVGVLEAPLHGPLPAAAPSGRTSGGPAAAPDLADDGPGPAVGAATSATP